MYNNFLLILLGETVARAIRRLAGGDVGKKRQQAQRKMQQKLKKGQVRIGLGQSAEL